MQYSVKNFNQSLEVSLGGRFTFSDNPAFYKIMEAVDAKVTCVLVDVTAVEFMDSAALGMLLVLKDTTDKRNIKLVLKGPSGHVKKLFEISKFYQMFDIQ